MKKFWKDNRGISSDYETIGMVVLLMILLLIFKSLSQFPSAEMTENVEKMQSAMMNIVPIIIIGCIILFVLMDFTNSGPISDLIIHSIHWCFSAEYRRDCKVEKERRALIKASQNHNRFPSIWYEEREDLGYTICQLRDCENILSRRLRGKLTEEETARIPSLQNVFVGYVPYPTSGVSEEELVEYKKEALRRARFQKAKRIDYLLTKFLDDIETPSSKEAINELNHYYDKDRIIPEKEE